MLEVWGNLPDYSFGKYYVTGDLSLAVSKDTVFSNTLAKFQITYNKNKLKLLFYKNFFEDTTGIVFNEIVLYKK